MTAVLPFPEGQIESVARLLGDCGSGTDISRVLADRRLFDESGESTKWRRLHWVFRDTQRRHACANQIIDFIEAFLIPTRFVGRSQEFESSRQRLNVILSFSGLELGADGKCWNCTIAKTLDEAESRLHTLHSKFKGR